jgi:hypothetical protein
MVKSNSTTRTLLYTALYVGMCIAAPDLPLGALKLVASSVGQFVFGVTKGTAGSVMQELPNKALEDVKDTPRALLELPKKLWENLNPFDGKFNE